jgi:hypothetical protein
MDLPSQDQSARNPVRALAEKLAASLGGPDAPYRAQRTFTATMMHLMASLLQAASDADPAVQNEVLGFPEGLVIGMSVLGDTPQMRLRKTGSRLVRLASSDPAKPNLAIIFKHLTHAFLVLSFQESTARSFANDRMITQGDVALAMRLVRCLNRMEAVTLPKLVAERALKAYPDLPLAEKLSLSVRTYAYLLRDVWRNR